MIGAKQLITTESDNKPMKRKLWALCLILAMLLSLGIPAMASEDGEEKTEAVLTEDLLGIETEISPTSVVVINPIYEEEETVEDILRLAQPAKRKLLKAGNSSTGNVYAAESVEDAGAYLRGKMVERATTATFSIATTEDDDLKKISQNSYAEAIRHTGNPREGDYLYYNTGGYSSNWNTSDGITTYTFTFKLYTTAEQEEQVNECVDVLMDQFNFDSSTTEYKKIRAIYDYMCANIYYEENDTSKLKYTAYAALIKKSAVCQGYAGLFYRLALESGLSARVVAGIGSHDDSFTNVENHGWNIVAIDGVYYNLDTTWDAVQYQGNTRYYYFLKGKSESDFIRHRAGVDKNGNSFKVPEELELLSDNNYAVPLEILIQPQDENVKLNQTASFGIAAMGDNLTYKWYVKFANGQTGSATYTESKRVNLGKMTEDTKARLHGATAYCVVSDEEGNTRKSETAKITYYDPEESSLKYCTVTPGGELSLNFYTKLEEEVLEDEGAYMHFTIPGETVKEVDVPVSQIEPRTIGDGAEEYYVFPAATAAKDMTQKVHAELYRSDGTKTMDVTYSVKDYCDKLLSLTGYSEEAKDVVKAMLNYGGYVQDYFNYHRDDKANATLEDRSLPDEVDLGTEYAPTQSIDLDEVTYKYTSLLLRSNTILRHYIQVDDDISQYTFTVNGVELEPKASGMGNNYYTVDIADIAARDLDLFQPLVITKGEESITFDYAVYSYIRKAMEQPDKVGEAFVNAMKALYAYGEKAEAYFQSVGQ